MISKAQVVSISLAKDEGMLCNIESVVRRLMVNCFGQEFYDLMIAAKVDIESANDYIDTQEYILEI